MSYEGTVHTCASKRRTSVTTGRPQVSVPVLSKTTVRTRCARSSASAPCRQPDRSDLPPCYACQEKTRMLVHSILHTSVTETACLRQEEAAQLRVKVACQILSIDSVECLLKSSIAGNAFT